MILLLLTGFVLIFTNLNSSGKGESELSAYAAFNKDGYKIPGSMDASQFEREIRHQTHIKPKDQEYRSHGNIEAKTKEHFKRASKAANLPCVCGSGKKYKKCCSTSTMGKRDTQEYEKWANEWTGD